MENQMANIPILARCIGTPMDLGPGAGPSPPCCIVWKVLAKEASRLRPTPDVLDTLGWVQLQRGEISAAVATFEKALEEQTDSPSIRYRLATALNKAGEVERAREMLRIALDSGTFPEAEAAKRQLALLEQP